MPLMNSVPLHQPRRRPLEGVRQILRFNYPMFLTAALLALIGTILLATFPPLPFPIQLALTLLLALGIFWALATLLVSHLVYDHHPTFHFQWIPAPIRARIHHWANIHAGFDQTTPILRTLFHNGIALDLFHPKIMTERSIHRARAASPKIPNTLPASHNHLPLKSASHDTLFLLFAAHELRSPSQRAELFHEAARALQPHGHLILLEHLRSLPNLLAFGPGAFHFHSQKTWLQAPNPNEFTLIHKIPLTPFATALIWRKIP